MPQRMHMCNNNTLYDYVVINY